MFLNTCLASVEASDPSQYNMYRLNGEGSCVVAKFMKPILYPFFCVCVMLCLKPELLVMCHLS